VTIMSKKLLFKKIESLLSEKNFKRDGNYYRRDIGFVKQALYLNPSRNGGEYFIEMLITYIDLNPERKNTQGDAHLKARLSSYYHPLGNPESQLEWTCRYEGLNADSPLLTIHLPEALNVFFDWIDQYPSWQVAVDKMKQYKFAIFISRSALFEDIGQAVPMPQ